MIKKIIKINCVLFLICVIFLGINYFSVLAEENDDNDWIGIDCEVDFDREIGIAYKVYDDESIKEVVIPKAIYRGKSYLVKEIYKNCFENAVNVESLVIPDSIEFIGKDAFKGCSNLKAVYYKGTIKNWCSIEMENEYSNPMYYGADFYMLDSKNEYYKVTKINLPVTIDTIEKYQFIGCNSLVELNAPYNTKYIEVGAFKNCINLTSVELSNTVKFISDNAFENCTSLTNIQVSTGLTMIGSEAFLGCTNLETIELPESLLNIKERAFKNCKSLKSINIPFKILDIKEETFMNCTSLTNIVLSDKVREIKERAFANNINLSSITIGNEVKVIGKEAFLNCQILVDVTLPKKLKSIGESAFNNCNSLSKICLPETLEYVGPNAFNNCNNLVIEYEGKKIPESWDSDWNLNNLPVKLTGNGCKKSMSAVYVGLISLTTITIILKRKELW